MEMRKFERIDIPGNSKINGVVNTYSGKTYIFYENNYCMELDECTLKGKSVKFISEIFPGIPSNITSVFRYTNGILYFMKDGMIYEYNEFLNKATGSYPFEMEKLFQLPCQSVSLLQQLKNLLSMIIGKQIVISNRD
ncbi:hypothetical protein WA026_021336 [Henosepilachna vigintioctopunctata]|uniref:Uncharacterized protein n=1 Tax=Henosepilachna vigintioctopunctata TaxID=420089 RepID=A0AAW1U3G5_9CUCU